MPRNVHYPSRYVMGGVPYEGIPLDITSTSEGMVVVPQSAQWEAYDHCECCLRFSMRPKIAYSWEQAQEFGWVWPVT